MDLVAKKGKPRECYLSFRAKVTGWNQEEDVVMANNSPWNHKTSLLISSHSNSVFATNCWSGRGKCIPGIKENYNRINDTHQPSHDQHQHKNGGIWSSLSLSVFSCFHHLCSVPSAHLSLFCHFSTFVHKKERGPFFLTASTDELFHLLQLWCSDDCWCWVIQVF